MKTAYLLLDSFPDYAVTIRIQAQGYQTLQRFYTNVTYVNGDKRRSPSSKRERFRSEGSSRSPHEEKAYRGVNASSGRRPS